MLLTGPGRATTSGRMLDLLRAHRTLSRVRLAELSGLTAPTITHVVRELVAAGLVHEVGRERGGRGQPRRLLALTAGAWFGVGIQLDRTTTTVVVVDFAGSPVATVGLPGAGAGTPADTVDVLARHVTDLLRRAGVPRDRVLGIGLVTHGPQDRDRGVLLTAQPTPEWLGYPVTDALADRLGLPVLLENDATAAAVGELWVGDEPTGTFGLVYMASGIGGAVIVDGEVYRGRASNAVEIGHVALPRGRTPCVCGRRGCAQAEAGPRTVVEQALDDAGGLAARLGLAGGPERTLADFERVARAWQAGDRAAGSLLKRSSRGVGQAAVVLADLFDLDTVVLAGPAFLTAGPLYRRAVARSLERDALSRTLSPPRVLLSTHVGTAAAIGGALHALRTAPVGAVAAPALAAADPRPLPAPAAATTTTTTTTGAP